MASVKLFLLSCAPFCALLFAQNGGQGVVSGTVVEASGGDPVRKAIVTITWQGSPKSWATTRTDGSGHFTFEGLPPGKYDLRAVKGALGTAIYGANSLRELGDLITLGNGETRANMKLRFLHSGSIAGRVLDQDGDPVPGVPVNLMRYGRNLGERVLLNYHAGAQTNDRGEYKITNVDPGEYYVHCNPNDQRNRGFPAQQMMAHQYYGGAREPKDATVLNLRGGDLITRVDFHLSAERPANITGHVVGVPPIDPPEAAQGPGRARIVPDGQVAVELHPGDDGPVWWGQGASAMGPDYRFEFPEMTPGLYRVQATVHTKGKAYYAYQLIDAHEGAADITLAMNPAVEVKGHLKVEGPAVHPLETFLVALVTPGVGPQGQRFGSLVAKDGSFTIGQVPPGEWILSITSRVPQSLQGMFDKSVRLGDKDFLLKRVEIPHGLDAPLNVVISSNTATVEGEIDAGGADVKRAGILLEPVGSLHTLSRFYYSAAADDAGKFKVTGVAPGKYRIFALEKIATESYRNPESGDLLGALEDELLIEVSEGAKVEAHPKLVAEQRAREILKP
jgi:protocatechuate 3,4-dioxygenase beta subunit